jgi:hypothetical protein
MRTLRGVVLALGALLLCATFAPTSNANEWNKRTIVTFGEAVEIPGQILPAGTYVFELADSNAYRQMVQIWDANQDDLLATVFTIPAARSEATGHSVFEMEERPGKSPMALKYWFYPGDITGQEFAYAFDYNSSYPMYGK